MLVLGLDTETTFTDPINPREAQIIEIGAVLWDTDRNFPIKIHQELVKWRGGEFDPRITDLTGFIQKDLDFGIPIEGALINLHELVSQASAIVAHNGISFDKEVLLGEADRAQYGDYWIKETPWIDTMVDIPFPKKIETRKLDFLAPSHGFINPYAHRACFDVLTMLKVMSNYDFNDILKRSTAQKIKVRAITMKPWEDGGKSNEIAKAHGFKFDGQSKTWVRTVLDFELADFKVPGLKLEVIK